MLRGLIKFLVVEDVHLSILNVTTDGPQSVRLERKMPRWSHNQRREKPTNVINSDVRHPRCVSLYNGKELRVEYTQSNTNILTSIINIMRVLTTTCFGLTCGPSSGCKIRLYKLYYNAWETLLGVGGCWGVPAPPHTGTNKQGTHRGKPRDSQENGKKTKNLDSFYSTAGPHHSVSQVQKVNTV